MKYILNYIYAFIVSLNPAVASVFAASASLYVAYQWVNQQWLILIAKVDALTQATFAGTLSFEPLALIDTIMPLHELLTYLSAWLAILLICTVIRVIKSFIPSIAT